jgi:hypothetical protein
MTQTTPECKRCVHPWCLGVAVGKAATFLWAGEDVGQNQSRVTGHEASVSVTRSFRGRMWLWWWPRTGSASYGSIMVEKARP